MCCARLLPVFRRCTLTAVLSLPPPRSLNSEDSYTVIDYALRDQIWVGHCQAEELNLSPVRTTAAMLTSRQSVANHLFRLKFRSNHSGEKVPMVLGAELL